MNIIFCDTNILINAFNGRRDTIDALHSIGLDNIVLSAITVMELYQGMGNKLEMMQMRKKIAGYDVIHIDAYISDMAIDLIHKYRLSNGLLIPDALIAATAIAYNIPLFTYNLKDFKYIKGITIHSI